MLQSKLENIKSSVVTVHSLDFKGKKSNQGSGVILKNKGVLVTSLHLLSGSESVEITKNGRLIPNNGIIGLDSDNDLLIVKLDTTSFPDILIANNPELKASDKIFTLSSPQGTENSYSEGMIKGLRRDLNDKFIGMGYTVNRLIQFTADIKEGSSGGAIFNENMELLGIISSQAIKDEIMNFAIPINTVFDVIERIVQADQEVIKYGYFQYAGNNAFDVKDFCSSIEFYSKYLEVFPQDYDVLVKRALAYSGNRDYRKALQDCDMAIGTCPDRAEAYSAKGEVYYYINDINNSILFYIKALKKNPYYLEANFNLSFCYYKQSNYKDALEYMNNVLQIEPLMFDGLHLTGNYYFELDKSTPAIEIYNKLSEISEIGADIYVDIGNAYLKRGHVKESEKFYDKALELEPLCEIAHSMKAQCCIIEGKKDEALAYINNNIKFAPTSYRYYYTRAAIYFHFDDFTMSIEDFKKCSELNPDFMEAYYHTGECFFRLGKKKEALEYYNKALLLKNDFTKALLSRGSVYLAENKPKEAMKDFDRCLELDKDNYLVYLQRGKAYFDIWNYDAAIEDFTIALKIDKKNSTAFCDRGTCYYFKEDYRLAIGDLNQAIKYDKNIYVAYYFLGYCKLELKLYKGAIKNMEQAILLYPEYEKKLRPSIIEAKKKL